MASDSACESVCSLPPEQLTERLAMIRRDIAPLVLASGDLADGREWRFADAPATLAKLENLIELERRCCAGLSFDLRNDGEDLVLSATGAGATDLFDRAKL